MPANTLRIRNPKRTKAALGKLGEWFERTSNKEVGGILVLPTGGGKTYTAVRFLCANAISKNFKVLWLAHTHHLLEQALDSFKDSLHKIIEPKKNLNLRVVSGAPEHYDVADILPSDDVLIATLQTVTKAYTRRHPALMKFLKASDGKLCVVFDEAHHSPAPTYAKFLMDLRQAYKNMRLLGLTATPLYADERKQGWLAKLFPQKIIYDVSARKLMAAGILAKPVSETYATDVSPDFDEREYQKWIDTYQDLPEDIITTLAENRERNAMIADTYVEHRERYGKTIMFADRWHQCEQLEALLEARGVRAGSIYSHVGGEPTSVAERNKRDKGFNAKMLDKFKKDELDVLLNVRMLTEGTDVPKVNTVFLTRQTPSRILLTQMVGRALRGPKFGGTEQAFIVAFTDQWKQQINWAEYDDIIDRDTDDSIIPPSPRPPLQLISIDLVRRLTRQMDSGININAGSFVSLMPLGWYIAEFQAVVKGSDDIESVSEPVMIFEHEPGFYKRFITHLQEFDLESLASENLEFSEVETELAEWQSLCFGADDNTTQMEALDVRKNLFLLMRHLAQNDKIEPRFFLFKEREEHDLDAIAAKSIAAEHGPRAAQQILHTEYHRTDRFWRTIYPNFGFFSSQYDGCVRRILDVELGNIPIEPPFIPGVIDDRELSEAVKEQVKKRDHFVCLCCGETMKRRLTIDHIVAAYYGINNSLDNLQTLCEICNRHKSINELNFRINKNYALNSAPDSFPDVALPIGNAGKPEEWEKYLRRNVNFFYQCAAVESVRIGRRGVNLYEWQINLYEGNSPAWLKPHLENLVTRINIARTAGRFKAMQSITVTSPNEPTRHNPLSRVNR